LALLLGLAAPGQALASGDAAARRVVVKHVQRIRSLSDQYALCAPDRPLCIGNAAYRVYAYARDARREVVALLGTRLSAKVKSGVRYYVQALNAYAVSGITAYTAVRTQNASLLSAALRETIKAASLTNRALRLMAYA